MATIGEVDAVAVTRAQLEKLHRLLERKCQAEDLPHSTRCMQPSAGYYHTICVHEHVRHFYLCTFHAELHQGWCYRCFHAARGPHGCW